MDRFEISVDRVGSELVQLRNLANGETLWTKRSRIQRHDGAWVLMAGRRAALRDAARNRKFAKLAAMTKLPEAPVAENEELTELVSRARG